MTGSLERTLACWIPDWPVHASVLEHGGAPGTAIALLSAHRVVACSEAARARGVRVGMREREAQALCPELTLRPHDPDTDERRFGPVLAAIEEIAPGVDPLRPGLCALRSRGPTRYYGSEQQAALAVLGAVTGLGFVDARIGIADGVFAAEQAARSAATDPRVEAPSPGLRSVAAGAAAAFLSPLPIGRAADPKLARLLQSLGIRTLGSFAALPEPAVRQRFGEAGVAAHHRARAVAIAHGSQVRPRAIPREYAVEVGFEPPLGSTEQLAFACAESADRFVGTLAADALVCTSLSIELLDDLGIRHERRWEHPRRFNAVDIVNRVRWQADALPRDTEREGAGVAVVRFVPTQTDRAAAHEPALWSNEPDARVHHRFTQVQSRLGHTGVGTAELCGGRLLAERQRFIPWGTEHCGRPSGPWPGALPAPRPTTVFPEPPPVELLDATGEAVRVGRDDLLTAPPALLRVEARPRTVRSWSAPWLLRERWWEGRPARARLQLVTEGGEAWLLIGTGRTWHAEGRYD